MLKQSYLAILPYGEIAKNMTDVGMSALDNLHIDKVVLVSVVTDFFTQFTQVHPDRLTLQDRTVLMSLLTQGKHYGLSDALYNAHIEKGVFIPETLCIPVILNYCSVVYQYLGPYLIAFYHKHCISPRNCMIEVLKVDTMGIFIRIIHYEYELTNGYFDYGASAIQFSGYECT